MKKLILLFHISILSITIAWAQPGSQDISVTSPQFLPAPLPPPNAIVKYRVLFAAPNGITLLPLMPDPETVGITVCLNKLEFVSPVPVVVGGSTVFTNWQIDPFAPNCATAVINTNQPIFTNSTLEFTLRVTGTSTFNDAPSAQNNVNVNLQPHANDAFNDSNDQTFVATFTTLAIDFGDVATPPYPQARANVLGGDANNDGIPDGIGAVWVGTTVDIEATQNTPASVGDDITGLDDEDGLTFPAGAVVAGNATPYNYFIATNSNSPTAITRHYGLWFDWDDDGDFDDFYSGNVNGIGPVEATAAVLIPSNAVATYKVRLVVSGNPVGNTPGAIFNNAEIEDYQNNAPLPVELLDFTAQAVENARVLLKWTTVSEQNNAYFSVQSSRDGNQWREIGQVKGQGNTLQMQYYKFWDDAPAEGVNYYRLQQVDTDGAYSFSPTRVAILKKEQSTQATLYPNPGVHKFYLQLDQNRTQDYQIRIFNQSGMPVAATVVTEDAGYGRYLLDVKAQPAGSYQVLVTDAKGNLIAALPLIKQ